MNDEPVTLWECPDCGFSYDAQHVDWPITEPVTYHCPACAEVTLATVLEDVCKAASAALALLDKQREEYNAAPTILPHAPYVEGPIAKAVREALLAAQPYRRQVQ